jgi:hypothetical protein
MDTEGGSSTRRIRCLELDGFAIFLKNVMSGLEASSQEKSWWKYETRSCECEIPYNSAMAAILARATCVSDSIRDQIARSELFRCILSNLDPYRQERENGRQSNEQMTSKVVEPTVAHNSGLVQEPTSRSNLVRQCQIQQICSSVAT